MSEHDIRVFNCVFKRRVVQRIEPGGNDSVSAREAGIRRALLPGGTGTAAARDTSWISSFNRSGIKLLPLGSCTNCLRNWALLQRCS